MSSFPPAPRSSPAPPARPAAPGASRENRREGGGILARGWVVRLVIVITLLLTLGMVSLIYVRWLTVQEPTATIVINGDPSLDGAQILLNPGPEGSALPVLSQDNGFSTPVHLQPGTYHLIVKLKDEVIFDGDVKVDSLKTSQIDLPTLLTVHGVPADDDANVTLTGPDERPDRQVLDRQSDYAAKWRLNPGTYDLTVILHGATLYENQALVISQHVPVSIDVSKPTHEPG